MEEVAGAEVTRPGMPLFPGQGFGNQPFLAYIRVRWVPETFEKMADWIASKSTWLTLTVGAVAAALTANKWSPFVRRLVYDASNSIRRMWGLSVDHLPVGGLVCQWVVQPGSVATLNFPENAPTISEVQNGGEIVIQNAGFVNFNPQEQSRVTPTITPQYGVRMVIKVQPGGGLYVNLPKKIVTTVSVYQNDGSVVVTDQPGGVRLLSILKST